MQSKALKMQHSKDTTQALDPETDQLIPDPQIWAELGITPCTGDRWTKDKDLGFPPIVKIRNRNYRSRRLFEAWKQQRIRGVA
jgi:hypothetical protein